MFAHELFLFLYGYDFIIKILKKQENYLRRAAIIKV